MSKLKYTTFTVVAVCVVCLVLFLLKPSPVEEWGDVFDLDCSCGNHMHVEPYDKNHHKIQCSDRFKVYEKGWKIFKWYYSDRIG